MPPALLIAAALTGCGTMNTARPNAPGEHTVGLTVGGPMFDFGAPIPVPSAVVEGRSGVAEPLDRPLEVSYGANLTAAAFGQAGLHGGVAWLLAEQRGGVPAVSAATKLYLYTNALDLTKEQRGLWALDQLEVTTSWTVGRQLLYTGLAQYTDLVSPTLMLSPYVGAELHPGAAERFHLAVETRYLSINQAPPSDVVDWISFGPGALAVTLGFGWSFGGNPATQEAP